MLTDALVNFYQRRLKSRSTETTAGIVTGTHALQVHESWWTGEDSNLRSPQGAADLQSAGFSHSPTRPAETSRTQFRRSFGRFMNTTVTTYKNSRELIRTALRGTSQCRKGSCPETPALALLSRGIRPQPCRKCRPSILPTAGRLSWRRELNPRPSDYKSDALPTELRQPRKPIKTTTEAIELQVVVKIPSKGTAKPIFIAPARLAACAIVQRVWQILHPQSQCCGASLPYES
jgi:hypothetical protein